MHDLARRSLKNHVRKETMRAIVRQKYLGSILRQHKQWVMVLNVGLLFCALWLLIICIASLGTSGLPHPLSFVCALGTAIFGLARGGLDMYWQPGQLEVSFDRSTRSRIAWAQFYTGLKYKKVTAATSTKYEELRMNDLSICKFMDVPSSVYRAVEHGEGKKWKEFYKPLKDTFSKVEWGFIPIEANF
jgi:hypothetical protein